MADYCVAYYSKTGTTQDMADRIAEYLNEHDVSTEVKDLTTLNDPAAYRGMILGGPINGMNMAAEYSRHVERLAGKFPPVLGVFAASITYYHGRKMWVNAIEKNVSAAAHALGSSRWGIFGGRSENPMPAFARWIFGLPKDMPTDTVNWLEIVNWIQGILAELREEPAR
jgi:flavodoxin